LRLLWDLLVPPRTPYHERSRPSQAASVLCLCIFSISTNPIQWPPLRRTPAWKRALNRARRAAGTPKATAVRIVLVRAGQTFPLKRVEPARYDMRYLNLDTGSIHRTDEFAVTAKKRPEGGVDYMGWTVPLYTTLEGNVYHDEITTAEF
jgi:hypothetical protein